MFTLLLSLMNTIFKIIMLQVTVFYHFKYIFLRIIFALKGCSFCYMDKVALLDVV